MKLEIKLEKNEKIEILHNALCNGLYVLYDYSIKLMTEKKDYQKAKDMLSGKSCCFEDIIIQILKNGDSLNFYDYEGEENVKINLDQILENMDNVKSEDILAMVNEEDDCYTADNILQTAIYGEIIYG